MGYIGKNYLFPAACVLLFSLSVTGKCVPQEFMAQRIDNSLTIDGRLDEKEWESAHTISGFTQFEPEYNAPAEFETTVKVLYNDRMIYFGFICTDPEPEKITAKKTKRDDDLTEDDGVEVFLDTFHDNSNAYFFAVNPIGTQSDGRFSDNGRTSDVNWDTSWESACSIGVNGWFAEFGIPFEVLKFNADVSTWGFNAERRTARTLERSFWIGELIQKFRVSQFGDLTGLDLSALSVKKYTIIPYSQFQFTKDKKSHEQFGFDLRYNLSSNLGLEATANPDFATIESDVEQINLTRFELSYPEKRPFFLEGAENYDTRVRQFYSRRIGEIPWGIKLNGKVNNWNVNAMVTESDPSTAGAIVQEGTKALYTVIRLSREFSSGSNIGIIGANRNFHEKNSGSLGLTSTLFFTDVLGMTSQVIKSHGDADSGTWTYFFRPAFDSQFTHFHVRYSHFGEGVMENMNATGFIRDDDRKEFDTEFERTFWLNRYGIEEIETGINYNRYWSQENVLRRWEDRNTLSVTFLKKLEYSFRNIEEFIRYEKDFRNSLFEHELEYDSKKGTLLNLGYTSGVNYDSDFEKLTGGIDIKLLEGWDINYNFSKHWFRPALPDDNSWIHFVRSTYFLHKDMYFKVFYQTKHRLNRGYPDPDAELLRKSFQVVFVWRIFPPFGSLQLAYQEGSTRHTDTDNDLKSLFCKLSWVF